MASSAIGTTGALASLPAGSLVDFAGSAAPAGWLMCDGSEISRTVYAQLFASISTTYGAGDGTTTFNLPDFRGRFARYNDDMGVAPAFRDITTKTAGSFVVGRKYKIATVGTTNFTLIGASANTVGVVFTATGIGAGTGTAHEARAQFTDQSHATAKNGLALGGSTTFASSGHYHSVPVAVGFGANSFSFETPPNGYNGTISGSGTSGANPMGAAVTRAATTNSRITTYSDNATSSVSLGDGDVETRPINLSCNRIIKY